MTTIIGVRYKPGGKIYYFDPCNVIYHEGENVIVDTSRGVEFGTCAESNHDVSDSSVVQPLHAVIRKATEEDEKVHADIKKKEARAFEICEEKIRQHELDMKLVEVEYNFEGSKILFFFTSEGRVDFRELVKDLAGVFRTRIELRQIGVRDEAKLLGGLGICGRPFCCSSFLGDFQPVSIKMAKVQNLSLNPTKISGTCGRLMCCLKYEQEAYEDAAKRLPRVNTPIETPAGQGTVSDVNLLRETVTVKYENTVDKKTYKYSSISDGIGEEYTPRANRPKHHLSESLLGIGFTAEEAFTQMEHEDVSLSDITGRDTTPSPAPVTPKDAKSSSHKRRHRSNKNHGEKALEAVNPSISPNSVNQPDHVKGKHSATEEMSVQSPGTENQHRNNRRRRGEQKASQNSAEKSSPRQNDQHRVKRSAPVPSKQDSSAPNNINANPQNDKRSAKSNGHPRSRNKYRGRAGNRPKIDSAPTENK